MYKTIMMRACSSSKRQARANYMQHYHLLRMKAALPWVSFFNYFTCPPVTENGHLGPST